MSSFQFSWVEWVGFFSALIYLYFSINQRIWLWPMGIISSLFYIVVFFNNQLYADMVLQFYYFIVSIIGWILWRDKQITEGKKKTQIIRMSKKVFVILFVVFVLLYVLLTYLLITLPSMLHISSSELPYWDAFTTAAGFVATWMLVKKMIDQWLIWVVVDIVAMAMYVYKELYPTSVLYFIYSIFAVWGYFYWLGDLKKENVIVEDD